MFHTLGPDLSPLAFQDLIASGEGILRRVVPARKDPANPVLTPQMPWEDRGVIVPSVDRDPQSGLWKMWYVTHHPLPGKTVICYAQSSDGITWERPKLGKVEFQGSRDNNILMIDDFLSPCVVRDDSAEPSQRYRMFIDTKKDRPNGGRIFAYVSADGIDWKIFDDNLIPVRNDSQNTAVKDPATGKWLCFHRPGYLVRAVARSESLDQEGHSFAKPRQVLAPDTLDQLLGREHYALAVHPYAGGFMGLLRIYDARWDRLVSWLEAVVSRDSINWQRLPDRTPLVGLGEDGTWDCRLIAPGHGLVQVEGGDWFYYDSWNSRHGQEMEQAHSRAAIGRAFIPSHGIFECLAEAEVATLVTYPLFLKGSALALACDAGESEIRASLRLPDGSTPEGFTAADSTPLKGKCRSGKIIFRGGELSRFAPLPVQVHLHLHRGARILALGTV